MGGALVLPHNAGDYMPGAAAFGHEVLGCKADSFLHNREWGEFFEVTEDFGLRRGLGANHPNKVPQKSPLWQGPRAEFLGISTPGVNDGANWVSLSFIDLGPASLGGS